MPTQPTPGLPSAPGLLIVEGDADRLRQQGHLDAIDRLVSSLQPLVVPGRMRIGRFSVRTADDLAHGRLCSHFVGFDAVVLVAHGDYAGVTAAPDTRLSWSLVADALAPLRPKALLAVSCFGGCAAATEALFSGVPTLASILGSPVPLTVRQAQVALFQLLLAVHGIQLSPDMSAVASILNAAETGGVVIERTRARFESMPRDARLGQDVLALLAWMLLRADPGRRLPNRRRRAYAGRSRGFGRRRSAE